MLCVQADTTRAGVLIAEKDCFGNMWELSEAKTGKGENRVVIEDFLKFFIFWQEKKVQISRLI